MSSEHGRASVSCLGSAVFGLMFGVGLLHPAVARADAADDYAKFIEIRIKAVQIIATQAHSQCDDIPISGYKNETEFKTAVNLKLNSIISKIVDAGGEASIKKNMGSSSGFSQENLAEVFKNKGNCRADYTKTMSREILAAIPPAPPAR